MSKRDFRVSVIGFVIACLLMILALSKFRDVFFEPIGGLIASAAAGVICFILALVTAFFPLDLNASLENLLKYMIKNGIAVFVAWFVIGSALIAFDILQGFSAVLFALGYYLPVYFCYRFLKDINEPFVSEG